MRALDADVPSPAGAPPSLGAGGWQAAALDLAPAWQRVSTTSKVVVAVVDTGVQRDHPSLAGRVLPGHDFANGGSDASDDNGHGTAVAGIVASSCPVCLILPVKVLGANGTSGNWEKIAAGITWASDHGAQVIDLSIGAPRAPDILGAAVSSALAHGVIVVAAAGNAGGSEPFYPAAYPGVVAVAAIDESGAPYPWSNHGSWVDAAAPGCASTSWMDSRYTSGFCGTSSAAPFVSAVAGLARAFRPTASPATFLTALMTSGVRLPRAGTAAGGRVDADRLLVTLGAMVDAAGARSYPQRSFRGL